MQNKPGALALTWDAWWDDHYQIDFQFSRNDLHALHRFPFLSTAREAQRPPKGDWRTWMFMGGRGAGKTRAGAEWIRFSALHGQCQRIALIGPTLGDVRGVMIEGPSRLREIEPIEYFRPEFSVSRRRLEWPNGALAFVFSAEDPDSLRGPKFDAAWCDEIAVWPDGEAVWSNLQFGLRLGDRPRCVATTTPQPVPLVKRLIEDGARVTHSPTRENAAYLADGFVDEIEAAYAGTTLVRQELGGELIEDLEDALWRRSDIDGARISIPPKRFEDIIVAVDPPTTSHARSDSCGIIAAGTVEMLGAPKKCIFLADGTEQGLSPTDWVRVAEDGYGLFVRGLIKAPAAFSLLKFGLSGLSIGFRPQIWTPRPGAGRILSKIDLVEVSLVAEPMLENARFHVISGISQ